MDDLAWVRDYLGRPWVAGAWDCWALLRAVYADRRGLAIPDAGVDASRLLDVARAFSTPSRRQGWVPVDNPGHLDAVLMGEGRHPTHAGVWLDHNGGVVLHCAVGMGTVCETPRRLKSRGWQILGTYRPA